MNLRLPIARQPAFPSGDAVDDAARTATADGGEAVEHAPPADSHTDPHTLMQVGDLARETGKTVRAIHLYEQLGLLTPAARSKGGYRLYGPEALVRIRWIAKLQEMGFSLGDLQVIVREFAKVATAESAPHAMKRMREVYARKLDEAREQRRRLEALEQDLELSLKYLDTCDVCDPKRLVDACGCCDLHDREADVPELVLGYRVDIPAAQPQLQAPAARPPKQPRWSPR
jgi:DNA-binding transcriptional MerR regulator